VSAGPDVDRYLGELVRRLTDLLKDEFQGAYAIGSLALGGFVPGRSDIDVVAVTRDEVSLESRQAIADALTHPALECPSRGLEFVLYARDRVATPSPDAAFSINLNTGPGMDFSLSMDPASEPAHWFVVDRSIARSDGVRLAGPAAGEMFAEIPRAWVLAALRESLSWHRSNENTGPNLVLNSLRAWRFARQGVWSSKAEVALWGRTQGVDASLIKAAVALRSGEPAEPLRRSDVTALLRRVDAALAEGVAR
jgi:hypothetical protein